MEETKDELAAISYDFIANDCEIIAGSSFAVIFSFKFNVISFLKSSIVISRLN